jgi:hypothetical protein
MRIFNILFFLFILTLASRSQTPRLLITTDIGGDPDDQQSLVRLMVYTNEFQIEGFICSASGTPGELGKALTRPDLVEEIIAGYGQVYPNLLKHDANFPPPDKLMLVVKSGNAHRGWENVGEGHDSEGSEWIIKMVDKKDKRPLNISIFGGQTDLAQALWKVKNSRSEKKYRQFIAKIRVYDIDDQDRIFAQIHKDHPTLFYILAKAPKGIDKREGAYRGIYLGGNESLTSMAWLKENVLENHGPLGKLYPTKTWTAPNPHGVMKEGDTPSWFFFLKNGLNLADHPEYGGWGGRFVKNEMGYYSDAVDTFQNMKSARATVFRWRGEFQRDWAARMDWCSKENAESNHAPVIFLNGSTGIEPFILKLKAGKTFLFDASSSIDPDGNLLRYEWMVYPECANYSEKVELKPDNGKAQITVPMIKMHESISIVLKVTDNGTPNLTSYKRINLLSNQ